MKYFAILAAAIIGCSSCHELSPSIDFGAVATDTTFMAGLEATQPHKVLIEECTGASCANCPKGTAMIDDFNTANPSRVVSVSIHYGPLSSPVNRPDLNIFSKFDFRTEKGSGLMSSYFGAGNDEPFATFDRTKNGKYFIDRSYWPATFASCLATKNLANVTVSSTYNPASAIAVIKVHIAYTGDVAKKQSLSLMITESKIIDAQENGTVYDTAYSFNHVLRDILTPISGSPILNDFFTKGAGRVYERTFVHHVAASWKPENCSVVAILHDAEADDIQVQQVAETNLK